MKVSTKKTEVMAINREEQQINIEDKIGRKLNQVNRFKYLGAILKQNGECEDIIAERIRLAWEKWKEIGSVINDNIICQRSIKLYKTIVRAMLKYSSESWTLRKKECQKLETTEIKM